MPTPISHIVLTEKIYDKHFGQKNRKEFYIGTCLPDIRRNAGIKRSEVHFKNLKLEDIKKEDSFNAGFKIHSLIDELSEKYFKKERIYEMCPEGRYKIHSLKVVKDRLCYDEIGYWDEFINYLDDILDAQLQFGIDRGVIEDWHVTLQQYFSKKPDEFSVGRLFHRVCYSKEDCDEINRLVKEIEKDKKLLSIINSFNLNFEDLLT